MPTGILVGWRGLAKRWQGAKRLSCKLDWKFAAKSHLHSHVDGTGCTSVAGEGGGVRTRMRRETERGKAKEVHCNRRHVEKGEREIREKVRCSSSPSRQQVLRAAAARTRLWGLWVSGTSRKISTGMFRCSSGKRAGAKSVLQHAKKEKLSSGKICS